MTTLPLSEEEIAHEAAQLTDRDVARRIESIDVRIEESTDEDDLKLATDYRVTLEALKEARAWVRRLRDNRIVTCVYCGHAYPPGSETHGAEVLKEHIRSCEKHPMREIELALKDARDALNRDRTGLAQGLVEVVARCRATYWVTEGRGSYEWDDDRYKAETHVALTEVVAIASRALGASGTLAGEEVLKADEALRKAQAELDAGGTR
ncbi:MAG: hypothetical protein HOW73_47965 [Polyangiaceae bacterium]|nr:hypothetical protein [Polyangiaceae bacterium]